MNKIVAKIDVKINDINYLKGEVIKVENIEQVYKLNAMGYIEPLTHKDLVLIERELKEEQNGYKEY